MKDMYLIMRCIPLNDQYECDADRIPIALTHDYNVWFEENNPDYSFEVWAYNGKAFECIKEYDVSIEEGMAFYYWENEGNDLENIAPHVIAKYPNASRKDPIPQIVLDYMNAPGAEPMEGIEWVPQQGYISWLNTQNNNYYVYGEYQDNQYDLGF